MALTVVVLALLSNAPTPIKLAAPGLSAVNVKPELQTFVTDHLNQQIVLAGIQLVSASEISAVLGLERQKQLLGCTDKSSSCVAELANALGVDGLIVGNLGQFGEKMQVDVRVIAASDARALAVYSVQVENQAGLLDALSTAAATVAAQVSQKLQRPLMPPAPVQPAALPAQASQHTRVEMQNTAAREAGKWIFIGSTVVMLTGGIVSGVAYNNNDTQTSDAGAWVFLGGLAGMLVGGTMYFVGGTEPVTVQAGLYPSRNGMGMGFSGTW